MNNGEVRLRIETMMNVQTLKAYQRGIIDWKTACLKEVHRQGELHKTNFVYWRLNE